MEKKLIEYRRDNGVWKFFFEGYEDQVDHIDILVLIKAVIRPETYRYDGEYTRYNKEGINFSVLYFDMGGTSLEYQDTGRPEDLEKVRGWVKKVWDALEQKIV